VLSSATTFTLGRELEHLTLTGSAAINGTGNTQNNRMVGNTGANVIDGGAGADTMEGGTGNDTYTVDHAGDVVTESPLTNGGSDRINASVSFVLGGFIESLTLTGVANIDGTGNSLNNQIFGNAGNNRLVGGGGSDMLFGGNGNDGYTADGNDQIFEGAGTGSGVDSVRMDASSYGLGSNLENLEFITTAAVQGAGNELANRIQGAAFGDFLDGRAGADVVYGMAGDDTIFGGADKDRLLGGAGKDHLGGGTGATT
jgi:Ca2+-binding RTX toxin-like protein